MRHNTQTKVTLVNFQKKNLLFKQYGPNLVQNYTTTNCSKDFQEYFSIMESNSQALVIFVNKILFYSKGQFGQKLCNLTICSLRIFLKICSMMGYKRPMQCWSTFLTNFLLVGWAKPNLGQNYATLSADLLSEIFF